MSLHGMHGTCASFAELIKKNGFNQSIGRRGTGVYFWSYSGTSKPYANSLAYAWWNFCFETSRYNSAQDKSFVLFDVNIETERIIDLEQHDLKLRLLKFVHQASSRAIESKRNDLVNKSYDLFVNMLEERGGAIDVIHVTVNPPAKKYFSVEHSRQGHELLDAVCPSCYVVKNTRCIQFN